MPPEHFILRITQERSAIGLSPHLAIGQSAHSAVGRSAHSAIGQSVQKYEKGILIVLHREGWFNVSRDPERR